MAGVVIVPRGGTSTARQHAPEVTTPAARVRVPPVSIRVRPPAVLGRELPEVRAGTPEVELTALP
jgi:hypothetical protein